MFTDDERYALHCAVLDAIDKHVAKALGVRVTDWVADQDLPAFLPALNAIMDAAGARAAEHRRQRHRAIPSTGVTTNA